MEQNDSISEMFTKFTDIVNGLKSLGKCYTNSDLVRKVLRSLPRSWEAKVTAIQEAKDLNTLPLEELLGSLLTHELQIKQHLEEDETKKKRTMALRSAIQKDDSDESSQENEDDDDLALITRKFKRFMKRKRQWPKKRPMMKGEPSKEKDKEHQVICYECKKPGHYKADCPLLKKGPKKFKKKAMMATWSDSDETSSEEDKNEVANLCLMANEEEVSSSFIEDFTFDELHDAFYELLDDFTNLSSKNKNLKTQTQNLTLERDNLEEENKLLKQENSNLKDEVQKLKPIVEKFTLSSNKLNLILNSQKAVFDKAGLGYNPLRKQKFLKNIFVSQNHFPRITCFKCGLKGHKAVSCHNIKKIWVPKGTVNTNPKGPKKTWVPKIKT